MIKFKEIKVSFKDIDFIYKDGHFKKNQVTFITGKNGSGKTTLLRVLASLNPYQGDLELNAKVTYNSQEPVIFHRSVKENILYPIKVRKLDPTDYEEKILDYTKKLEIDHLLENDASKLSSGEKMKTSIIRSIIFDPDIILLDEPTTHLDLDSIKELIDLIKSLKHKITFIIVSHNESFMNELLDNEYKVGDENVSRKIN